MTAFTALPTVSVANFISEANLLVEIFGSAVILAFEVMEKLLQLQTTKCIELAVGYWSCDVTDYPCISDLNPNICILHFKP